MKHIQKDYRGQDVHSSGICHSERCHLFCDGNDEDQAVPSVMMLIEKLTDEEVDARNRR